MISIYSNIHLKGKKDKQLTDHQTPGRIRLRIVCANSKDDDASGAREVWNNEMDQVVLGTMYAAVAGGQADIDLVRQPARVQHGQKGRRNDANVEQTDRRGGPPVGLLQDGTVDQGNGHANAERDGAGQHGEDDTRGAQALEDLAVGAGPDLEAIVGHGAPGLELLHQRPLAGHAAVVDGLGNVAEPLAGVLVAQEVRGAELVRVDDLAVDARRGPLEPRLRQEEEGEHDGEAQGDGKEPIVPPPGSGRREVREPDLQSRAHAVLDRPVDAKVKGALVEECRIGYDQWQKLGGLS